MAAWRGPRNFLHHKLSEAPGRKRRSRGERLARVHARDFESAAACIAGKIGAAVSQGASNQSSFASDNGGRRGGGSTDWEAEYRRGGGGERGVFLGRRSA